MFQALLRILSYTAVILYLAAALPAAGAGWAAVAGLVVAVVAVTVIMFVEEVGLVILLHSIRVARYTNTHNLTL